MTRLEIFRDDYTAVDKIIPDKPHDIRAKQQQLAKMLKKHEEANRKTPQVVYTYIRSGSKERKVMSKPVDQILEETVTRTYNLKENWGAFDSLHATLGVCGEAGEIADAIKRWQCYDRELDLDNVKEEIGDMLYYLKALCLCTGTDLQECAELNQTKLQKRYPDGFTTAASIERADKNGSPE